MRRPELRLHVEHVEGDEDEVLDALADALIALWQLKRKDGAGGQQDAALAA